MMHLPALGIKGNSHMLMQDKNSDQLADLVIRWIDDARRTEDGRQPLAVPGETAEMRVLVAIALVSFAASVSAGAQTAPVSPTRPRPTSRQRVHSPRDWHRATRYHLPSSKPSSTASCARGWTRRTSPERRWPSFRPAAWF